MYEYATNTQCKRRRNAENIIVFHNISTIIFRVTFIGPQNEHCNRCGDNKAQFADKFKGCIPILRENLSSVLSQTSLYH